MCHTPCHTRVSSCHIQGAVCVSVQTPIEIGTDTETHLGCVSCVPVPHLMMARPPVTDTVDTQAYQNAFFFASFTSRRGPNDAATTRRKWAIYDFVPRTSASHTEGICLQKTSSYGSF